MEKGLKFVVTLLGSFMIMVLILTIPILCGVSFALDWATDLKSIFSILTGAEAFFVWWIVAFKSSKGERL